MTEKQYQAKRCEINEKIEMLMHSSDELHEQIKVCFANGEYSEMQRLTDLFISYTYQIADLVNSRRQLFSAFKNSFSEDSDDEYQQLELSDDPNDYDFKYDGDWIGGGE